MRLSPGWARPRPHYSRRHAARQLPPEEIEAVLAHELGHHVHRHILKSIFVQAGDYAFRFLGSELDPALRGGPAHVRGTVGLRQPATAGAGFRSAVLCADACPQCLFAL